MEMEWNIQYLVANSITWKILVIPSKKKLIMPKIVRLIIISLVI